MAERVQQIVIIRHGETAWSKTGQHTGRTDLELLDEGRTAAVVLAERLRGHPFTAVWSSPLRRAWDTCELAGLGASAVADPDLEEWHYGAYEGLRTSEIQVERPGWSIWDDGVPDGETIEDVAGRARRVLQRVRSVDGDVALVAHGHLLRILASCWLGADPRFGRQLALGPASISVLSTDHEAPAILHWNG